MQVLVDLSRCQSYGQCVYAAPDLFRLEHEEVLEWEYAPDDGQHERVVRAAASCPVQAITYGPVTSGPVTFGLVTSGLAGTRS
jgi:ferredoxin